MTTCYHEEKRLFFVHIPKCAGTAIGGRFDTKSGRWEGCWLNDLIPGWTRRGLPNGHQPVRSIEKITGHPVEWWNRIIVTIRDPRAQQWSQWNFWRKRGGDHRKSGAKTIHQDDEHALATPFSDWLHSARANGPNACVGHDWQSTGGVYRWWMVDRGGQIPPNVSVVRIEDGDPALIKAIQPFVDEDRKWPTLPTVNATKTNWTQHDWSSADRQCISRKFAWSIANYYPDVRPWI